MHKNKDRCSKCGNSTHVEGFQCPAKKFQCKACQKFGHFSSVCYQKKQAPFTSRRPKALQLQAGTVYAQEKALCGQSKDYSSSDDSFCLQIQVQCTQASSKKFPTPTHLVTNLAYRLQPHHARNQHFKQRLDTCVDVNIMPTSVYYLLFEVPELRKLDPCNMKIGTYTKDAVKIVDSCKFYLVHLDTKKLQEVTFFVAKNDGSVLLSCTTTLELGLIQPRIRLYYIPPRSSLITCTVDHPKKTRCQAAVHSTTTDSAVPPYKEIVPKQEVPKLITSKEQILKYYPDVLRGLENSHVPHITYSLILVYHQSKLPATQFLSSYKRGFSARSQHNVTSRSA